MRIIVKPMGAAVLAIVVVLLVIAFCYQATNYIPPQGRVGSPPTSAPTPSPNPSPTLLPLDYPWRIVTPIATLQNAGFEDDYAPIHPYDKVGTLTGSLAGHWYDDSSWAKVTVDYAQDQTEHHSGRSSQRITVKATEPGQVQFVHYLQLIASKKYTGGFWVRSEKPIKVHVLLRQARTPYTAYSESHAEISTKWQHVTTHGAIGEDADIYLMLQVDSPGVVWVDDASLTADP